MSNNRLLRRAVDAGLDSVRAIGAEARAFWSGHRPTIPAFDGKPQANEVAIIGGGSDSGRLAATFQSIADSVGGLVGVTALNLETGDAVALNGSQQFPMASLVKVPLALVAMELVDHGRLALDRMVVLKPSHVCPGHGVIASHLSIPGVSLSVRNLIELSLTISDNTAADALLDVIGGPEIVTQHLRASGLDGLTVTRSLRDLLSQMTGVTLQSDEIFTDKLWAPLMRQPYPPERTAAIRAFFQDPRDTATTNEMCRLLSRLCRSDGLSQTSSAFILGSMHACRTGSRRLRGLLPPGTRVAHKTGSLEVGFTADIGIFELPAAMGSVAVSAFILGSADAQKRQDVVFARLGRAAYDYFSVSRSSAHCGSAGQM